MCFSVPWGSSRHCSLVHICYSHMLVHLQVCNCGATCQVWDAGWYFPPTIFASAEAKEKSERGANPNEAWQKVLHYEHRPHSHGALDTVVDKWIEKPALETAGHILGSSGFHAAWQQETEQCGCAVLLRYQASHSVQPKPGGTVWYQTCVFVLIHLACKSSQFTWMH